MEQQVKARPLRANRRPRGVRGRISQLVVGAMVLGLVGSYTASAHITDQTSEGQLEESETLSLRLAPPQETRFIDIDLRKKGPSRGDRVYIKYRIFNEALEPAGHTMVICEQFSPKPRLYFCQQEDHVRGRGTLLSEGFQNLANLPLTVYPIVGGTGEFRNARGQTTLDFETGMVTFDLLP